MPSQHGLFVITEPQTRLLAQGSKFSSGSRCECIGVIDNGPKLACMALELASNRLTAETSPPTRTPAIGTDTTLKCTYYELHQV